MQPNRPALGALPACCQNVLMSSLALEVSQELAKLLTSLLSCIIWHLSVPVLLVTRILGQSKHLLVVLLLHRPQGVLKLGASLWCCSCCRAGLVFCGPVLTMALLFSADAVHIYSMYTCACSSCCIAMVVPWPMVWWLWRQCLQLTVCDVVHMLLLLI
jgi:hypothetical protein